jgi:hypothetical protein
MVNVVEVRPDLGTEPSLREGMVRIAVKLDRAAILNFRDDAASIRAIVGTCAADEKGSHASDAL